MNITKSYQIKSTSIQEPELELDSIKGQISSLKLIIDEENDTEVITNCREILNDLRSKKTYIKAGLNIAKCEFEKRHLEKELYSLSNRFAINMTSIDQSTEEINKLSEEVSDLENQLESLRLIEKKFGNEGIEGSVKECENTISQKKSEIEELEVVYKGVWLGHEEDYTREEYIKAQIFNLEEKTRLKNALLSLESALIQLHKYSKTEANPMEYMEREGEKIKEQMKSIIKERIHLDSFFKIVEELHKAKNLLANLEYLEKEEGAVDEEELEEARNNLENLKNQIAIENRKVKLQKELKEVESGLLNLNSCVGSSELEDVAERISLLEKQSSELRNAINEITMASLGLVKGITEREVEEVDSEEAAEIKEKAGAVALEELKKWLTENMLKEAINADVQEVIVCAALLSLTKRKVSSDAKDEKELSTKGKIKSLAIGACEKFCMSQILQYMISTNPALSAVYGAGVLVQHYMLDDAQTSTLLTKIKRFMVSESIKYAGTAILGTMITGVTGTMMAIPAALYTVYSLGSSYWQSGIAVEEERPISVRNLSSAAIDMVAESAVESIFARICS